MIPTTTLLESLKNAKSSAQKRNFVESVDLVMMLKDVDTKKQELNLNETVFLPNKLPDQAKVCVFASGDLALRASKAGVDRVVQSEELDKLASDKRASKKLAKGYDFFLAETAMMSRIGRSLGQYLGPRGKMPAPLPPNAPIEGMLARYRTAVRVRARNQLSVACKVGDASMSDQDIMNNLLAAVSAVERKLPQGERNIRSIAVKLSMGKPIKMAMVEA